MCVCARACVCMCVYSHVRVSVCVFVPSRAITVGSHQPSPLAGGGLFHTCVCVGACVHACLCWLFFRIALAIHQLVAMRGVCFMCCVRAHVHVWVCMGTA